MLYGIVSNLTAAALLAHAVLGCCWHHAHRWPLKLSCTAAVDLSGDSCSSEACGHEGSCSRGLAGDDHHGDDGCEGVPCAFVPAPPNPVPAASPAQDRDVTALVATAADLEPAGLLCCDELSSAAGCCPPLRIHLLHQVLLL